MTTKQIIKEAGKQKLYSGSIIQSLISDLWETMDANMENMKGIMILSRAAKYLQRVNDGTL